MPSGGAAMEADAKVQQELADALLAKAWSGRTAGALRRLRVHTHARMRLRNGVVAYTRLARAHALRAAAAPRGSGR
jgi:hypothetical protein